MIADLSRVLFAPLLAVGLFAPAPFPRPREEPSAYLGVDVRQGEGGVLIAGVYLSSPAHEAGLNVEEVIVSVDGKPTPAATDLAAVLRKKRPGDRVAVVMRRGGEARTVEVRLAVKRPYALLGTLQSEATVVGFFSDSPARKAGVEEQDVIVSIGGHKVNASKDIATALKAFRGEEVVVVVRRGAEERKIPVKLGARPGY